MHSRSGANLPQALEFQPKRSATTLGAAISADLAVRLGRTDGCRKAFAYPAAGRRYSGTGPQRILADSRIGARDLRRGYCLPILDTGIDQSAFSRLTMVGV
jgi:hypothetical protein